MSTEENYLWDPSAEPDQSIAAIERVLRPHSAQSLDLAAREWRRGSAAPRATRVRAWPIAVLAMAAAIGGLTFSYFYRLSWSENTPWPMTIARAETEEQSLLRVGESISTVADQTATLNVARIGTVVVLPNSSVELLQTSVDRHRLDLKYGRLKAKIWAPPLYFSVTNRDGMAIDMGCEFEMDVKADGSGTMTVSSGWVIYRIPGDGVMVPEGHSIAFSASNVTLPVRDSATPRFRELVRRLDALLASESRDDGLVNALTDQIAEAAEDADRITLLILVSQHRELLRDSLRSRLVKAFGDPGDGNAIDVWWDRLPKQPKKPREWWGNWRDAF